MESDDEGCFEVTNFSAALGTEGTKPVSRKAFERGLLASIRDEESQSNSEDDEEIESDSKSDDESDDEELKSLADHGVEIVSAPDLGEKSAADDGPRALFGAEIAAQIAEIEKKEAAAKVSVYKEQDEAARAELVDRAQSLNTQQSLCDLLIKTRIGMQTNFFQPFFSSEENDWSTKESLKAINRFSETLGKLRSSLLPDLRSNQEEPDLSPDMVDDDIDVNTLANALKAQAPDLDLSALGFPENTINQTSIEEEADSKTSIKHLGLAVQRWRQSQWNKTMGDDQADTWRATGARLNGASLNMIYRLLDVKENASKLVVFEKSVDKKVEEFMSGIEFCRGVVSVCHVSKSGKRYIQDNEGYANLLRRFLASTKAATTGTTQKLPSFIKTRRTPSTRKRHSHGVDYVHDAIRV